MSQEPDDSRADDRRIIARRVRAALGYSGDGLKTIGERSGLGASRIRKISARKDPRGASTDELLAIADACGVPRSWLARGQWADGDRPTAEIAPDVALGGSLAEARLALLERHVLTLLDRPEHRGGHPPTSD